MRASVLLCVLFALVLAAPAQARPKLCDDRPGTTVAATSVGRVFRDRTHGGDAVLRGCRHGRRTVQRLGVDGDCADTGSIGQVIAVGRYVALTRVTCDTISGDATILLFDLRSGRDLLGTAAYSGTGDQARGITSTGVTELVLTAAGALAWVGRLTDASGVTTTELHLRRAGYGAPEVVATSDGVDITDVALTARRLYWLQGGTERAIVL